MPKIVVNAFLTLDGVMQLKQVEAVSSAKGGTYHRLERGGKPTYGRMGT